MQNPEKIMEQYRENLNYLINLKKSIGNINNRIHSSAVQLAVLYLMDKFPDVIDWEYKGGSESGLDIIGKKDDKPFIVGELKSTYPYGSTDFGAQQKTEIQKDLQRLEDAYVSDKYFFIINKESFDILNKKYINKYPSVKVVNILEPDMEFHPPEEIVNSKSTEMSKEPYKPSSGEWDIEIKLTAGPLNGGFFNISTKYHYLIGEGEIEIISDDGAVMHCNTVESMGKGRITKNLKQWFKRKKFKPEDRFYLKKIGQQKFKVIGTKQY